MQYKYIINLYLINKIKLVSNETNSKRTINIKFNYRYEYARVNTACILATMSGLEFNRDKLLTGRQRPLISS